MQSSKHRAEKESESDGNGVKIRAAINETSTPQESSTNTQQSNQSRCRSILGITESVPFMLLCEHYKCTYRARVFIRDKKKSLIAKLGSMCVNVENYLNLKIPLSFFEFFKNAV